jgi:hypothetical protein
MEFQQPVEAGGEEGEGFTFGGEQRSNGVESTIAGGEDVSRARLLRAAH